jgi:5-methylcytosine-specific restriction endonuclease McrA
MKLKLTPQRLAANRANSVKGGLVRQNNQRNLYLSNPSHCKNCNITLPQEKKNNAFCSRSCAASYNNSQSPKRKATFHNCPGCGISTRDSDGVYCSSDCYQSNRAFVPDEVKRTRRNEVSANYRSSLKNQTPNNADRAAMREFYLKCPEGYEVDHIVPISKGGLHTLENLQYLTITENRRKGNKII